MQNKKRVEKTGRIENIKSPEGEGFTPRIGKLRNSK
jgi:hypothetical protein